MFIKKLNLSNFKNHQRRSFEFFPGVTGIIGRNGSGKSSIVEAICFAMTGQLDGTKSDTITAGCVDGYVECIFDHNGHEGIIKRALDGSRVALDYAGQKIRKSKDVNDLWYSMFDVDPAIFNNVVVAKQKSIPSLFSGSQSVREDVFQRIFAVPNCESIRRIIWDEFIKQAPPLQFVGDIAASEKELVGHKEQLQKIDIEACKIERVKVLAEMHGLEKYIADIRVAITQQTRRIEYTQMRDKCVLDITQTVEKLQKLQMSMGAVDVGKLMEEMNLLIQSQAITTQLEANKKDLARVLNDQTVEQLNEKAKQLYNDIATKKSSKEKLSEALIAHKTKINTKRNELQGYSGIHGSDKCPVCGGKIEHLQKHIEELEKEIASAEATFNVAYEAFKTLCEDLDAVDNEYRRVTEQLAVVEVIDKRIKDLVEPSVVYDQKRFEEIKQLIFITETQRKQHDELTQLQSKLTSKLQMIDKSLGELLPLPTEEPLDLALEKAKIKFQTLQQVEASLKDQEIEYIALKAKIEMEESDLVRRKQAELTNTKINSYVGDLQAIYQALHPAEFPRKLVSSYFKAIEDQLAFTLQKFEMPFSIQLGEGCQFTVFDQEGNKLPAVSGGQEMVIGVCLRVALHSLFGRSFPMMIIDEGTNCMDVNNKKLYFDMIASLKSLTGIGQILIVDHNQELCSVVDHTIDLN